MRAALRGALHDTAGNTLLLFPAAVLVILGLGGVAVDSAALFLGQRRVVDLATAVAHDALAGVDRASYYHEGVVVGDSAWAADRREQLIAQVAEDWTMREVGCTVAIASDRATATCRAEVRPILVPLWWADATRTRVVTATETARGVER